MSESTVIALVVGVVLALWLMLAGWALYAGLGFRRRAARVERDVVRLEELLEAAPAIPMLVRPDGRIDAPARLADWLGVARMPNYLGELAGIDSGLLESDGAGLAEDIAAAQKSGGRFSRAVRTQDGARTLIIRGTPAGPVLSAPGGVILWFFDATESQLEIGRLGDEVGRLTKSFGALAGLIEASPFPMWHRGADLRLALVNSAYVKAVEGRDAADVIERGLELVEASGGRTPFAMAAAAREADEVMQRTVPATIGGERRMMRVVDVPIGEAGVAGFAIDIEETEQLRTALNRLVAAERNMFDRLSAGVAQFSADRSLIFCNQPFQRIFGMKPEWLADRPEFDRVLERMREAGRVPEVRDFPGWKQERRGWFLSGEAAAEESWLLPGGAHLRVVAQPSPDGGLFIVFEDRTEQLKLESARDTLLRVRTATFNNLFEAIAVFAGDGRLNLWNDRFREIWGLEEKILTAHPRIDALVEIMGGQLANPERGRLIRELVRVATNERQHRSGRVALRNGHHYEFAAVPLPDGNALFTMLDISDSRRIEQALRDRAEALEDADKLKTAFVANMSYELRTPLTSIGGFAEMLQQGYAGPLADTARDYVGAIIDSVTRLSGLIDDVLDLTQGGAGGVPMEHEPVDLHSIASEIAAEQKGAMTAKGITFALDLDPSVGQVSGDARRLRRSVAHMIRNAIAMTPENGRILLHGSGDGAAARIVVSDDGAGMNADQQAHAFDRFSRADRAPDGDDAFGLGLPLARQYAEAHGGSLTLYSEPGEGTVLTMEIPR
ncbi:sensor histidine kinase [Sphingomonas sp. C3-2]|uniref:sensor histidine kinase n=1 Tax=Sphingomonas sp. C3-2 TaxID=3062169 RepID=UPI00294B85FC|nr:PAS-domain containing protein [Sphingomonas sp. C3-2]WOK37010.1 PAS-domain containing protein [Sphingomonas sp. C3-2]